MEKKATEFLLSQTRDALDNALKKSMHEREVLSTTSKGRFYFFLSFHFRILTFERTQKLRAFDLCVQSMVSTIRKQRIRIRELEGVNTQDDGKNDETESLACKASACAVARDAATYINGRLRGLDEYIHEKEIEQRSKGYDTYHVQALKAVLRARAVASTAAAAHSAMHAAVVSRFWRKEAGRRCS